MWVLVSPQGRSTGAPLVAAFPFCSTKSTPVPATSVWKLWLIILLCATSKDAQHSWDLMIIGSSGAQRKERDACQSGYICVWLQGDGSVHDTSAAGHPDPLPLPPARGLMVVGALVWARPVVMWDPLEVASTRDGRSIDKAGEKRGRSRGEEAFYLRAVLCSPSGKDLQTAVDWKMSQVPVFIVLLRPLTILVSPQVQKIILSHSFQGASISFMLPHHTLVAPALVTKIIVPLFTSVWIILHALIFIIYNLEPFFALEKSNLDFHLSLNNSTSQGEPVLLLEPARWVSFIDSIPF